MSLRDRLLGDPRRLPLAGLERGIRLGSEGFVARCARDLGERSEAPREAAAILRPLLTDPRAAVRRAAIGAVGHLGARDLAAALRAAAAKERTEEGQLAIAVALARCGEPAEPLTAALQRLDGRLLVTVGGPRAPSAVLGGPPLVERFWLALGGTGAARARVDLLAERRAAVVASPTGGRGGDAVQGLAALQHPDDLPVLLGLFRSSGRRGEHALFTALGLAGDPRAAPVLRAALRATDVDPGRGFAQRRIAATALGRLSLTEATPWLLRALEDEAADYEGRPGAGLGIQYPVRTNLLWALGEIGSPTAVPALLAHLADTHGSALGGFYLPAMDALVKLGEPAFAALRAAAAEAPETTAAHAVSVLAAAGEPVDRWRTDRRATVRRIAESCLAAGPSASPPALEHTP